MNPPNAPRILTTTVGSYPVPDWLAALPSAQALLAATRVVFNLQRQAGIDLPTDGELYRFDANHPDTNGMIEYFVHKFGGVRREKLVGLGSLHPGSLSQQYNVCGKPGCRCKARPKPRRHGPYYKVSYVFRGRFTSRFVPRQEVAAVCAELANYKRLRKLTEAWVGLACVWPRKNANCRLDSRPKRFTLQI